MRSASTFSIQPGEPADLAQIHEIYTYYVLNTTISFLVHAPNLDFIASKYHETVRQDLPYLVAVQSPTLSPSTTEAEAPSRTEDKNKNSKSARVVLGYIHASPFNSSKLGYAPSLELTLYVHPDHLSAGVGSALLHELISQLQGRVYSAFEKGQEDKVARVAVRRLYSIVSQDLPPAEPEPERDVPKRWTAKGEKTMQWYRDRFGFEEVGRLRGVGEKFGQRIDVVYLEKQLDRGD